MSIASRAAKSVTWTFDPTVAPENDVIREIVSGETNIFTGRAVSVDKALGFVPVMAAISLRSETIGSLPFGMFERLDNGKRPAPEHRIYSLLHDQANPEMTAFVWREVMQSHIEAWGNCYAEIEFDTDDFPLYLWPLRPDRMQVFREDGELIYLYRTPDGKEQRLSRKQVFHIPGLGYDGRIGYSRIHMARQALALGLAAEEMAGRFYANDARPGVAIKLGPEYDYDDAAKKRLAESWDATHSGLSNKHRTAVLDEGMGIEQIGWPADDAQLVEQQKWSVEQVCRIFNIPPHMLHALDRATFNNVEELGLNFVTYSLRPWLVRWEQQVKMQLLAGDQRHFAEFNVDGLLRGKLSDRMASYWQMFQMSSISPDEIRAKENLNPLEDGAGEVYYHPVNIAPIGAPQVDASGNPVLPPLQIVGGTRSAKATSPADERRDLATEFAPMFEKVTAGIVDFERRQVLAEAERRFRQSDAAEATKALADALSGRSASPAVQFTLPDGIKMEPPVVNIEPTEPPIVHVHTDSFADAVREFKEMLTEPKEYEIIRNREGRIVGLEKR